MNKYNDLLSEVAYQYEVLRGSNETEIEYKTRLVYSICGLMAYASLWDDSEESVSITHLKRKIRDVLINYKAIYPELFSSLPFKSEELEDEITDIFLNTGIVYHCPNRIISSAKREEPFGTLLFQRGIAIDNIKCVSGIGFYTKQEDKEASPDKVKEMFGLEQMDLLTLWGTTLDTTTWETNPTIGQSTEYLRLKPPFSKGYWVDKPDTSGCVSILRTGMKGTQLYYLYRYADSILEVSPLPQWQVESYNYRTLSCACLSEKGTLPPIEYMDDGELIHIRFNYLLPPRELAFLRLYSWPEICTSLPNNFQRKMSKQVFVAIKEIFQNEGYEFKGGIN